VVGALIAEAPAPAQDDHPMLHRLHKRATTHLPTMWRIVYNIPRNDPRALEISDHEAACDLLERAYYNNRFRRNRPDLSLPADQVEQLDELLDEVAAAYHGGGLQRHLQEQLQRRERPQRATIRSIEMKPRSEP
jgi:hypothetical protein